MCRTSGALLILPLVALFMVFSFLAGMQGAWDDWIGFSSPSNPRILWGLLLLSIGLLSPAVVSVSIFRNRDRSDGIVTRLIRAEILGTFCLAPGLIFGIFLMMASAI